jgi:hypothetical protein
MGMIWTIRLYLNLNHSYFNLINFIKTSISTFIINFVNQ